MKTLCILIAALLTACAADAQFLFGKRRLASAAVDPAIQFIGYGTNTFNGTNTTVDLPAGTEAGDIITVALVSDTTANWDTFPPGFSNVESNTLGQAGCSMFRKIADGGEDETLTFAATATEQGAALIYVYRSANGSPIEGGSTTTTTPGAGNPHSLASVTPSVNNCLITGILFRDPTATATFTEVSGYTIRGHAVRNGNAAIVLVDKQQTTAGAESLQVIESEGGSWGSFVFIIKP